LCIYLKKIREITPSDKKNLAVPLFFEVRPLWYCLSKLNDSI
jgi:hypothetical protein